MKASGITELPQDWEKQTLGGYKQNLVYTGTQETGAVTPHETEPDPPVSVLEAPAEAWVDSGLPRGQGDWLQQSWQPWHAEVSHFEGGRHCPSLGEGEHGPAHQQKIGLKIY